MIVFDNTPSRPINTIKIYVDSISAPTRHTILFNEAPLCYFGTSDEAVAFSRLLLSIIKVVDLPPAPKWEGEVSADNFFRQRFIEGK